MDYLEVNIRMKTLSQNDLNAINDLESEIVDICTESKKISELMRKVDLIYENAGITPYLVNLYTKTTH